MSTTPHNIQFIDIPGDVVRVVQLTDTHLCKVRGGTLLGMDTDHSLQAVLDLVKTERPQVHLLLGTGDLSDGGARPAYDRLQRYFDQLSPNNYWLPGNHDSREAMVAAASNPDRLCKEIRIAGWQVLLLDSQVPGQVGGELGASELAVLEDALQAAQERGLHTLVCLHHQPVAIGCVWLDEQMVADAGAFFAVLDRYPAVRGVLWGHVHQEIDRQRNGVRLLASPSTCVQFAAGCENFKADDQPPGYRWLELHSDGRIETAVSRVRNVQFNVELDSGGYL
ncbi:MAG: 3',5'-cyclic-AMP phosphodiesterase [Halioglobus sp.]|nr:3',5'-cyclic-AMP phosphodiesterase [Halioglobus sp.]